MDLTCGSLIHHCDDMMETLFDEDSGLGMDFDFRNVSIQNKSFQTDIEVEISNNRFNPATFLCLFQARSCIYNFICRGLFLCSVILCSDER